uniref:Uncharacterized protein n=1 Tax=Tetranychus urticae TaxID=32264 RepID=T1KD10_TETUR
MTINFSLLHSSLLFCYSIIFTIFIWQGKSDVNKRKTTDLKLEQGITQRELTEIIK